MTHPKFDKGVALKLRDAVLNDRELPHGAKVIWWLIHTRLVSTAEGIQTGAVTITIRGFQEVMAAKRNSICEWTQLLRTKGFLDVRESPARHSEFPSNVFFLPPSIPKDTRTGIPKDTRTGIPKDTRTGIPKDTLLRDTKRQEEGGERGKPEAPPFAAREKAINGEGGHHGKARPENGKPKAESNGVPKFLPIAPGTFHSTLEKMRKAAVLEQDAAKALPEHQVRALKPDVAEIVADYETNNRPRAAERIAQLKADPRHWKVTGYTPHGQAVIDAWKNRITEIENAMKGIVNE